MFDQMWQIKISIDYEYRFGYVLLLCNKKNKTEWHENNKSSHLPFGDHLPL